MWGAGWGYWGWGWWFWIFWAVVVFILIWGGTAWSGNRTYQTGRTPEEQILRERYARGEIDRQEFEQRLNDLRRAA